MFFLVDGQTGGGDMFFPMDSLGHNDVYDG